MSGSGARSRLWGEPARNATRASRPHRCTGAQRRGSYRSGRFSTPRGTRARRARPVRRRTVARAAARWPSRRPSTTARYSAMHRRLRGARPARSPRAISSVRTARKRSRCSASRITSTSACRRAASRALPLATRGVGSLRRHHPRRPRLCHLATEMLRPTQMPTAQRLCRHRRRLRKRQDHPRCLPRHAGRTCHCHPKPPKHAGNASGTPTADCAFD